MCGPVSKFASFSLVFLWLSSSFSVFAEPYRVAIVIDDIGYRYSDKKALDLPGNVTYSILPHTPYGKRLALKAQAQHNDVLLHIPMESENGKRLGPGALTSTMNEKSIHDSLARSYQEIPFAIGINNHMGSRLTKLYNPMMWTMKFLKDKHLFFLDSKTSAKSLAEQAAVDVGVPVRNRHVFLDNKLDDAYIEQQFNQLIAQAKKHKLAIAIAHPHPETIKALTWLIPELRKNNIELVPLSDFYRNQVVELAQTTAE
jgi:polysaccharide deacetylase 2 family uncharacterized protein YibQ